MQAIQNDLSCSIQGSGRLSKPNVEMIKIIEEKMEEDNRNYCYVGDHNPGGHLILFHFFPKNQ